MKKIIAAVLAAVMLMGMGSAFAIEKGEARAVIGANLTEEQIKSVYSTFGEERGKVEELTVTNDEERKYLNGLVDSSLIGTKSISSVYVEVLGEGEGLQVGISNINWCTKEMYVNALVTAGISDAKLIVTSPIAGISGTAALTGIFKAYEDITGQELDETAKLVSTQELVVTAELADEIGSYDAVTIVNELKKLLSETENMSDEELIYEINYIVDQYNIKLSDGQRQQLVKLCRSLEGLGEEELKAKVEQAQSMLKKMADAKEKISGVTQAIKSFFEDVKEFFSNLFSKKN